MSGHREMASLIRTRIGGHVIEMRTNEAAARLGDDPEGVHLMRVAVRRLRSDLRLFRRVLTPIAPADLGPELSWLGAELGAVRDADVLWSVVTDRLDRMPAPDRGAARLLLPALEDGRRAARADLVQALGSERYSTLLVSLDDLATSPISTAAGRQPARRLMPRLARRAWRRLHSAAEALGPRADDPDQLHHLRILTKRARYAIEACDSAGVSGSRKLARRLARLQDHLGELHDLVVARDWLRQATLRRCDADIAFAAGELAEMMWQEQCRLTETWHNPWNGANGTRSRPWSGG